MWAEIETLPLDQDLPLFFVPLLEKSFSDDNDERKVKGIASDGFMDEQDEVVLQEGLELEPLMRGGYINWDHQKGPDDVIGEPTLAKHTDQGLYVEGVLYKGLKKADAAWTLGSHLQKSGSSRRLGWSVEGRVLQRSSNRIIRAEVRHLALTHQPVNVRTFAEFAKSMSVESGVALQKEHLAGTTRPDLTTVLWGDCSCGHFDGEGKFTNGRRGAMEHLVKCQGHSVEHSKEFMMRLFKSNILR